MKATLYMINNDNKDDLQEERERVKNMNVQRRIFMEDLASIEALRERLFSPLGFRVDMAEPQGQGLVGRSTVLQCQ